MDENMGNPTNTLSEVTPETDGNNEQNNTNTLVDKLKSAESLEYDDTPNEPVTKIVDNNQTDELTGVSSAPGAKSSVIASTEYTGFTPEHNYQPSTQQKDYKRSDTAKSWQVKRDEKPSEIVKSSGKIRPGIEATEKNRPNRSNLDERDQYGLRSNRANTEKKARRIKFLEHVKEHGEKLREGRVLDQEEVDLLLQDKLSKLDRYQRQRNYYESKGLDQETIEYLLTTRDFKKDIDQILGNMKNSQGEFHSKQLDLDDIYLLHQTYKEKAKKEYAQDENARIQERGERERSKQLEDYQKYAEEYNKKHPDNPIPLNREDFLKQQKQKEIERERNLYKEGFRKQQESTPAQPETTEPEIDPNEARRKRRNKTIGLVASAIGGAGLGLAVGGPTGVTVSTVVSVAALGGPLLAEKLGQTRMIHLQKKIAESNDPQDKAKLEKRLNRTTKFVVAVQKCKSFLSSFGLGVLGGSFINQAFLGGEGLVNKIRQDPNTIPVESNPVKEENNLDNIQDNSGLENSGTGAGGEGLGEIGNNIDNVSLSPDNLPDRLTLDENWSNFTEGLEIRSGNNLDGKNLLLAGVEGGDGNSQRLVMEEFLRRGINPNTQEAGWAFGELATQVRNGADLTSELINNAFETAKQYVNP
jgi:uncharacterized short protein YbdD (DUF466 family)